MIIINFECRKCKIVFDSNIGKVEIDEKTYRPVFKIKSYVQILVNERSMKYI